MANGQSARLEAHNDLSKAEWIAVGEASGVAEMARILSVAAISRGSVEEMFDNRIVTRSRVVFDASTRGVVAERHGAWAH